MENIRLRQCSSLGGKTAAVTELMFADNLECNTADEEMHHSHGLMVEMDVILFALTI